MEIAMHLDTAEGGPTPNQADEIHKLRQALLLRGLDYPLPVSDVVSRDGARSWLALAQARLTRPSQADT